MRRSQTPASIVGAAANHPIPGGDSFYGDYLRLCIPPNPAFRQSPFGTLLPNTGNPLKPDWLICKLTEKGRRAVES
jgi:hypothetical protein